jgi:hypothetical protein
MPNMPSADEAFAFVLYAYAVAGALVCIAASSCRLHKMHPARVTKWVWFFLYVGLFALSWYALVQLLAGRASPFEQAVCLLAGCYMLATIDSWRQVPAVVKKNKELSP